MDQDLLIECADWIAEQMSEEGYMIDAGLIQLILEKERSVPIVIPDVPHGEAATLLVAELAADGVQGVPEAVNERLVVAVLEWEDDFLAFAGKARC
ncbi:MAG: hypothetical protein HYX51_03825 [Chloroflexi bacterium]|nr:hypothetical protein [Chloroflexota bacterium]